MTRKNFLSAVAFAFAILFPASASAATTSVAETPVASEVNTGDKIGASVDHYDSVNANSSDVYYFDFRGGYEARVTVIGDHDTDLDLYIYDENGNLIDSDIDNTDICVCTWTPRWTGRFKVKIVNRGSVYNNYRLMIP